MPMDILPAPTAASGGAASGASPSPAPGASSPVLPGSAPAVFSLLLALIAQPPGVPALAASPLAPSVVPSASLAGTLTAPSQAGAKSAGLAEDTTAKSKDESKDKSHLNDTLWTLPVPVAPSPLALAPVPVSANTMKPGTAMDTAPLTGSESLSQIPTQTTLTTTAQTPPDRAQSFAALPAIGVTAPSATPQTPAAATPAAATPAAAMSQTPSLTDMIVPAETTNSVAALPAAISALVPIVAAQASQEVVVPSAPPTIGALLKSARVAAAPSGNTLASVGLSGQATPPLAHLLDTSPSGTALTSPTPSSIPSNLQNDRMPADNQPRSQAGNNTETVTITPQERSAPSPTKPAGKTAAEATTISAAPALAAPSGAQSSDVAVLAPTAVPLPASAAMPAPDRTRMVNQVSDSVQTMASQGGGSGQRQVTLQLHPKDWGQLNVTVTMTPTTLADGKMTTQVVAHVAAENPAVKAALETHQTDLRQTLQSAGLHLDKLTVTVQAPAGGAQAGLGNDRQPGTNSGSNGTPAQNSAQGGTSFSGQGNNSQSAFAGFAQGDSSRRPPMSYGKNSQTTGPETTDTSVASTNRSGLSSRVDIHA